MASIVWLKGNFPTYKGANLVAYLVYFYLGYIFQIVDHLLKAINGAWQQSGYIVCFIAIGFQLTPYEYIIKCWQKQPERFKINPTHHKVGLNS